MTFSYDDEIGEFRSTYTAIYMINSKNSIIFYLIFVVILLFNLFHCRGNKLCNFRKRKIQNRLRVIANCLQFRSFSPNTEQIERRKKLE